MRQLDFSNIIAGIVFLLAWGGVALGKVTSQEYTAMMALAIYCKADSIRDIAQRNK